MGHKTLKRVPLDFDWPVRKIWSGYVNPHYRACPNCENGYTPAGSALQKILHLLMIAGGSDVSEPVHPWLREVGIERLSSDMVELSTGLAGRPPVGRGGHDTIDNWVASKKIVAAAGLRKRWGICKSCNGSAVDPAVKKAYSRWRSKEPPKGDGWQLWETCSEGSPVSPVFSTAEDLASWCEKNAFTVADFRATAKEWLKMFSTEDGCDVGTMLVARC